MNDDRVFSTPSGVALGSLDSIPDGAARNFVLQMRAGRFHGFIVRDGNGARGFVDRCPHMGVPLAQKLDDYLSPAGDKIVCSWHGAVFDKSDGLCQGGPCRGQSLTPWPIVVSDGKLATA